MIRLYLDKVDSTNNYLKTISTENDEMVFVMTKEQTNGRGYNGNSWQSHIDKSLTFSFSLSIKKEFDSQKFNFWLSDKIATFLSRKLGRNISLKWPNDLFVDDKKLGGILLERIEGNQKKIIAGIGINVNQKEFSNLEYATSLHKISNLSYDIVNLYNQISEFIFDSYSKYENTTLETVMFDYNDKLYGKGKKNLLLPKKNLS